MKIVQDIYTKNILAIDVKSDFTIGQQSNFGEVVSIEQKTDFQIVWVKSNSKQENLGAFLNYLESIILDRKNNPSEKSYTSSLLARGINKVAQKVGEEAVEVVIEAKDDNKDLFLNESSDLLYHILVLIVAKGYTLDEVISVLKDRH
jgi:phosphoribosyl-ATP pyrophosphohydrolase